MQQWKLPKGKSLNLHWMKLTSTGHFLNKISPLATFTIHQHLPFHWEVIPSHHHWRNWTIFRISTSRSGPRKLAAVPQQWQSWKVARIPTNLLRFRLDAWLMIEVSTSVSRSIRQLWWTSLASRTCTVRWAKRDDDDLTILIVTDDYADCYMYVDLCFNTTIVFVIETSVYRFIVQNSTMVCKMYNA